MQTARGTSISGDGMHRGVTGHRDHDTSQGTPRAPIDLAIDGEGRVWIAVFTDGQAVVGDWFGDFLTAFQDGSEPPATSCSALKSELRLSPRLVRDTASGWQRSLA